MKRLAVIVVMLVAVVGAGSSAASRPSVNATVTSRERVARREAVVLLRRFVAPRAATRLVHPPALGTNAWPGSAPLFEYATRVAYWRTGAPLDTVTSFIRAHPPHGLTFQESGSGLRFRLIDFTVHRTRYVDVVVLRRGGVTYVRAQADVTWTYPRSPREKVPSGVREIDIKRGKVVRRVRNSTHVTTIIRWFDALPVSPPGVAVACPLYAAAQVELSFRSANGTSLATAAAPALERASLCDPIGFAIHEKQQPRLVDFRQGPSFVSRVEKLVG